MKESKNRWGTSLVKGSKLVVAAVGTIVLLMAAYHGFNTYIDYRIEKKISDLEFIEKISHTIRPSVVFDQKDSILADMGAMAYIDNIKVVVKKEDPIRIVVSPNAFLGVPPLLESLDGEFGIIVNKGKKYDWVYELKSVDTLLLQSSGKITNHRFRIEVIK